MRLCEDKTYESFISMYLHLPFLHLRTLQHVRRDAVLLSEGVDLKVFANRTVGDLADFKESVSRAYGVDLEKAGSCFHGKCKKFVNVRIALLAFC